MNTSKQPSFTNYRSQASLTASNPKQSSVTIDQSHATLTASHGSSINIISGHQTHDDQQFTGATGDVKCSSDSAKHILNSNHYNTLTMNGVHNCNTMNKTNTYVSHYSQMSASLLVMCVLLYYSLTSIQLTLYPYGQQPSM